MVQVEKLSLLVLDNFISLPFITPPFSGGVFVCLLYKVLSPIILFSEARLIGIYCIKTDVKTISATLSYYTNAYTDSVASAY